MKLLLLASVLALNASEQQILLRSILSPCFSNHQTSVQPAWQTKFLTKRLKEGKTFLLEIRIAMQTNISFANTERRPRSRLRKQSFTRPYPSFKSEDGNGLTGNALIFIGNYAKFSFLIFLAFTLMMVGKVYLRVP